jgi:soluble lytic murein transglycosylase
MLRLFLGVITCLLLATAVAGEDRAVAENDRPDPAARHDSAYVELFDGARLLASFGESRPAYAITRRLGHTVAPRRDRVEFEVRLLTELGMYGRADSLLARSAPLANESAVYLHALQRGRLNLLGGRYEKALDCLAVTDSISNPMFGPFRDLVRLKANLGLDRTGMAIEIGERLLEGDPPESLSPELELALIKAYTLEGRPRQALDVIDRLLRRSGGSGERTALQAQRYRLFVEAGDMVGARSTAIELARSAPRSDEAERVSRDLVKLIGRANLHSDELLALVAVFVEHTEFRDAKRLLQTVDERRLSPRQREERLLVKARYFYRAGDYRTAAALAKPRFQTPAYRRESVLILARAQRRSGKKREAADVYRYFAKTYPNDGKAAEALHVAAILYGETDNNSKAQETLAVLRKSYPSSYYGRLAAYRSVRYFNRTGRLGRSVSILDRAVRRSRRTDEAALYYLADTYGKLGDKKNNIKLLEELQALNPHSFYVQPTIPVVFRRPPMTSTGKVALDGRDGLLVFLTEAAERKRAARRALQGALEAGSGVRDGGENEARACVTRGVWFLDAGFREWGERELDAARRHCFDSPAALLDLGGIYDDYGMPWRSIRLYQRVKDSVHWKKRSEFDEDFRYLMFPVPYPIQVLENAARYDLPPHLVYAMIREESGFDRNAISRVGAVGLMQLMPETGRYVARELELPDWGENRLFDPEINLAFGIWYASSMTEASTGDYLKMLAAYNAGLANAKRWFASGGEPEDPVEVIDGIDYKETRLYVQRIIESANVYHSLYFDTDRLD